MKEDVKKIIMVNQSQQGVDGDDSIIFKSYAPAKEIAERIFESYKKQYIIDKDCKVFFNDDKEKKAGYLSNIYGCTGILSLVNRMGAKLQDEDKETLVKNLYYIIDYIEDNGYTLFPYLSEEENLTVDGDQLFNKRYPYIGAMTWALSFFTSIRKLNLDGEISIDEEYNRKIVKNIRNIIDHFNSSLIKDSHGNPLGWAFTNECSTPSLFFTYSVLEAYSDFEDNIMSILESEVEGEESTDAKDKELLELINKKRDSEEEIQEIWKNNCFAVADNVWNVYKDVLKDSFVDDTFLNGYKIITKDDIYKSNSSNALFNNIFLVFILVYGYVNVRSVEKDDVVLTMNAALQNVQRIYDQLKKEGMEYLVDSYVVSFKSKHLLRKDAYIKSLNSKKLIDATLMPILVKANNIIAFYISRYPVKQMSSLFDELFDEKSNSEWIWENKKYDVKITERYIEAIADFYAYYDKYERGYAERLKKNKALQEQEREKIRKRVESYLRPQLQAELAEQHEREKKELKDSFLIENIIRAAITEGASKKILTTLENIIAANKGDEVQLDEFETKISNLLKEVVYSYLFNALKKFGVDDADKSFENLKTDLSLFFNIWFEKLSSDKEVISKIINKEK